MNEKRRGPYVVALLVGALLACGKTVATIPIPSIGKAEQVALPMAGGSKIGFAVHAGKYTYSGSNGLGVEAELLKGGVVVAKHACIGFDFEGGAGSGCGATHYNSSCTMSVPPGGADTVRVNTHVDGGSANFTGVEIRILEK
jgi:hypothetical protein